MVWKPPTGNMVGSITANWSHSHESGAAPIPGPRKAATVFFLLRNSDNSLHPCHRRSARPIRAHVPTIKSDGGETYEGITVLLRATSGFGRIYRAHRSPLESLSAWLFSMRDAGGFHAVGRINGAGERDHHRLVHRSRCREIRLSGAPFQWPPGK